MPTAVYASGSSRLSRNPGLPTSTATATAAMAASTRPEALLTVSFMNDWTNEHVAGYQPRSVNGFGSAPTGPGLGTEVDDLPGFIVNHAGRGFAPEGLRILSEARLHGSTGQGGQR